VRVMPWFTVCTVGEMLVGWSTVVTIPSGGALHFLYVALSGMAPGAGHRRRLSLSLSLVLVGGYLFCAGVERSDIPLSLGQKRGSQEAQPPRWELRQRRERKEFEIQIKSKLSSFLAQPSNDIQRSFLSCPSLK
jgi:hypothetical protein